ncbi:ATP-dependent DNA helicase Q4 [Frankliniella fusca]|uniref:DNA 3'-5' helicase n=1 Tax=Frankliniella fusca TaxID=407009 RepID=A0AAE1HLE3_9NEOP|nr:ATP-dependent DNA helicase Q4 [Frankliniella fusca]
MEMLSDPALRLKYNKSKLKVKLWESEFRKKTGNNPSKDDIKEAPSEIRDAYKWYWQIKIHALGQDSMLDATFEETKKSEPSADVPDSDKSPTIHSNDYGCTKISIDKQEQNAGISCPLKPPSPSKIELISNEKILFPQKSENVTERTKEPVEISKSLPKSVWGTHLNRNTSVDDVPKKKNLNRSSSSFHLSEKLFVGAKLKKRNPRKSLSFTGARGKDKSSLVSSDSLIAPSDSSFSLDNSQGLDDGFPICDLENEMSMKSSFSLGSQDFKLVQSNATTHFHPVSAVHKMIEGDIKQSKPKVERSLDKGWLERVMQADELLSQEVKSTGAIPSNKPGQCQLIVAQRALSDESDDDIISGSDNESNSPRKMEKEEKTRLALRSTVLGEPNPVVPTQNNEPNLETTPLIQNSEGNVKKRKLDAIEAAMAVLSERRKNEKTIAQPSKKIKRATLSNQGKRISNEEENENDTASESSSLKKEAKVRMSKKDVLEKKVASGSINDNFVRINIQKKVFVRGKKTMNFQKYKKQQWKNKKKELSEQASAYMSRLDPSDSAAGGGLQKCFQCGDIGHFARQCTKMKGDSLMPNCDEGEEESPFPSLEEVEKMAKEKLETAHFRPRNFSNTNDSCKPALPERSDISSSEACVDELGVDDPSGNEEEINAASVMKEPTNNYEKKFRSVEPLYPLKEDGSLIETPSEVYDCLHKFGHQNFRPGQEVAIMRILSGLSTLVTLSTGSGKSLCYQLPAYLFASKRNCITLVVSPLVSLMDDQVSGLPSFINGAALHTGQTEKQREKVIEQAKAGKLQFLLVSPEAVVAGERNTGFGSLLRSLPDISFACIDEAHCVSQWSHNFRPSYLVIFKVLREKLGVQTVLGLTATATQAAVSSIIEHMEIPDGYNGVIKDTPLPNNLLLTVSRDAQRDQALLALLNSKQFKDFNSIIVYCIRREECERLAAQFRTCLKHSSQVAEGKKKISPIAEAYHAGLSSSRRKQVQAGFMSGNIRIVVATVAFGMGINKADIRAVIHFNMPRNFESYVQEVGRAGRDSLPSRCHLFLNSEGKDLNELRRHIFADSVDRHTIRKLLQRVFVTCKCGESPVISNGDVTSSNVGLKHDKLNPLDKDSKRTAADLTPVPCVGHEVAFSVEQTVAALDLPEENITTLLCYLELHDKNLVQVMPKAYTSCRILSYKGMRHIREAARSCPPLAMAIAMDIMSGKSQNTSHQIEFPVVEIASAIGWDSGIAKRELMNLEWTKVNGNSRRSGIKVEFSDLGFRLKAPGNLAPEKLDAALDFLHERVVKQEQSALNQLQTIFNAVTSVSFANFSIMESKPEEWDAHSNDLKKIVRDYFEKEITIPANIKTEEKLENGDQIANDIRQMVFMYRDTNFTGRAVARIFHGIGSPNFPPQVWGRCRFWRAHLESDFKLICLLATRVLLQMR